MTQSLDLILLPLHRQGGQDKPELPGLFAASAPRRGARGRTQDRLLIHLELDGTAPLSPKGYAKLMDHLADTYFKTSGSATSAMKVVAEWLNQYLLDRNLRGANRGMQSVGVLTLGVLRGDHLYLTQSGSASMFFISANGIRHFQNQDSGNRGLGLGKVAHLQFNQVAVQANDICLFANQPPPVWTMPVLSALSGQPLMQLHLGLIDQVGPELKAGVLQIAAGAGKLRILRPEPARPGSKPIKTAAASPQPAASPQHTPVPETQSPQPDSPPENLETAAVSEPVEPVRPPRQTQKITRRKSKKKSKSSNFWGPALRRLGQVFGETLKQGLQASRELGKRMLPDESMLNLPNSVMAITAIAVPVFVVAIAAGVYFKRGREQMYVEAYFAAQQSADIAMALEDAAELRLAWSEVIGHLDRAESFMTTENSQSMRSYALTVLDNLDYIVRLNYRNAFATPLPANVAVKRIVTTKGDTELYLLNETDGRVLKAQLTDQGYVLTDAFVCGPVQAPYIVGPLVDIVALPLDNPDQADIMGIDANGTLLKCLPGGAPPLSHPLPPPDMNWGTPVSLVMDGYDTFVLDPMTNAVWIFWGVDDYQMQPTLFFDEKIPPMGDVIDLTIHRDDLFLLHLDGHVTTCTYGFPTRCTDPAVFNDLREDKESGITIDDAIFGEIQFAPPPDPSIFVLDPANQSIYHFSMRLTYQRQYRPNAVLSDSPATAFRITENHQAFIAFGNQVFYTPLP